MTGNNYLKQLAFGFNGVSFTMLPTKTEQTSIEDDMQKTYKARASLPALLSQSCFYQLFWLFPIIRRLGGELRRCAPSYEPVEFRLAGKGRSVI